MNRPLGKYDQCVKTATSYNKYIMKKNSRGICFGASLYWASDVLREIANDSKTIEFTLRDKQRFYDFGAHIQKVYREIHHNRMDTIIRTLNHQEDFLANKTGYKLKYTLISGASAKTRIDLMIKNHSQYRNTAIILCTELTKPLFSIDGKESTTLPHATAFLNYEGDNYLFDINRGVYPTDSSFSSDRLVNTIANNFNIANLPDNKYGIYSTEHIVIELQSSSGINKKIETRNYKKRLG